MLAPLVSSHRSKPMGWLLLAMARELGFPACVGRARGSYLCRWVCLGTERSAFRTFRRERPDPPSPSPPLLTIVVCRPSVRSARFVRTLRPESEPLCYHSGEQSSDHRCARWALAEVGSTFLLQQSPAPGALPARRDGAASSRAALGA